MGDQTQSERLPTSSRSLFHRRPRGTLRRPALPPHLLPALHVFSLLLGFAASLKRGAPRSTAIGHAAAVLASASAASSEMQAPTSPRSSSRLHVATTPISCTLRAQRSTRLNVAAPGTGAGAGAAAAPPAAATAAPMPADASLACKGWGKVPGVRADQQRLPVAMPAPHRAPPGCCPSPSPPALHAPYTLQCLAMPPGFAAARQAPPTARCRGPRAAADRRTALPRAHHPALAAGLGLPRPPH